jgi:hypothetical protein
MIFSAIPAEFTQCAKPGHSIFVITAAKDAENLLYFIADAKKRGNIIIDFYQDDIKVY